MTEEDAAIDSTLLDYEVINLIAFHVDLRKRGIIKEEESDSILSALCSYLEKKIRVDPEEEDIHAYLENRIREVIGKNAENLRLFLSRNEQSQCNLRYEQRAESIEPLSSSLIIPLFLRSTWKAIRLITS